MNRKILVMTLLGGALALDGDFTAGWIAAHASSSQRHCVESRLSTATPIKHVLIIIGENRSFDHLFATYVPRNTNESVLNLLSEGIINADGTPLRARTLPKHIAVPHQFRAQWRPLLQ